MPSSLKNAIVFCVLFFCFNAISFYAGAQKKVPQGEIIYEMIISSDQVNAGNHKSPPVITMHMKFNADKESITMDKMLGMGKKIPFEKIIYDFKNKEMHILMNMEGKKYDAYISTDSLTAKMKGKASGMMPTGALSSLMGSDSAKTTFTLTDSVVRIIGYPCKKYTGNNKLMSLDLYACDSIQLPNGLTNPMAKMNGSDQVKGFPLKTISHLNLMGIKMDLTLMATKLEYKKIKPSEFEIPKGYERIAAEDLDKQKTGNIMPPK